MEKTLWPSSCASLEGGGSACSHHPMASPTWCVSPAAWILCSSIILIHLYPLVSTLASVFLCRKWLSGKGNLVSVVTYAIAFIVEGSDWITYGHIYGLIFSFESSQLLFRADPKLCFAVLTWNRHHFHQRVPTLLLRVGECHNSKVTVLISHGLWYSCEHFSIVQPTMCKIKCIILLESLWNPIVHTRHLPPNVHSVLRPTSLTYSSLYPQKVRAGFCGDYQKL